jgi:hypothetical protein
MTDPREIELWLCGYVAKCSARFADAPLRSCATSTTRGDSIIRPTLATPNAAAHSCIVATRMELSALPNPSIARVQLLCSNSEDIFGETQQIPERSRGSRRPGRQKISNSYSVEVTVPKIVQLKDLTLEPPPRCPRCGHDQTMPALTPAQLIAALVLWQNAQSPNFQWSAEELRALEGTLATGDLFVKLFANSVTIRRKNGMELTWQRGHEQSDRKKESV